MHADHPRACGANFRPVSRGCSRFGSSPRVRGKRCKLRQLKQQIRIIPARAGQTNIESTLRYRRTDHPRACGANLFGFWVASRWDGSSPRVRGKRSRSCPPRTRRRIIPARAGQTQTAFQNMEKGVGSSPRVRGKRRASAPSLYSRRIIPARAGQTGLMARHPLHRPDHPRACGANPGLEGPRAWYYGSSPRVRGKRRRTTRCNRPARIIPARAGQTSGTTRPGGREPDHPRACGANSNASAVTVTLPGSSPRVRGKPLASDRCRPACRIIPARAGQTW